MSQKSQFEQELMGLINRFSLDNAANTPDFVLARYLCACLDAFNEARRARAVLLEQDSVLSDDDVRVLEEKVEAALGRRAARVRRLYQRDPED